MSANRIDTDVVQAQELPDLLYHGFLFSIFGCAGGQKICKNMIKSRSVELNTSKTRPKVIFSLLNSISSAAHVPPRYRGWRKASSKCVQQFPAAIRAIALHMPRHCTIYVLRLFARAMRDTFKNRVKIYPRYTCKWKIEPRALRIHADSTLQHQIDARLSPEASRIDFQTIW